MTKLNVDHIRVPKTAELVADRLRRQIVRGELSEGDALPPETQLLEQFGVSRPTLREAFRVLEAESLISVRRGSRGGARVHAPDVAVAARYAALLLQVKGATLKDVYDARIILEPPAAGLVARRATKSDIDRLQAALDAEASAVDDRVSHGEAATHFHETMIRLAGNRTLAVLAGMLHEIIVHHTYYSTSTATGLDDCEADSSRDERRATRAHARLLELVRAGDADGAEEFWRVHMEAAGQLLLREHGAKTVVDVMG
jgi:DNA-binding FadR family transcriptional regulator